MVVMVREAMAYLEVARIVGVRRKIVNGEDRSNARLVDIVEWTCDAGFERQLNTVETAVLENMW